MAPNDPYDTVARLGYYPYSDYLRRRFGCKVHKVSLDAGFTCPNRDGRVGVGGCTYCINESFSPNVGKPSRSVAEQMRDGMAYMRRRYKAERFIAYFQAFTNTYAPVERLKALYDEAVQFPEVVGLSIGTRPDCAPEPVLDLIESYSNRLDVWIEYGLQSAHDATLRGINRGHDFQAFADAVQRTVRRRIHVCAHVILGLPGETKDAMLATARALAPMGLHGIKVHHLYIARNTAMERDYLAGRVEVFTAAGYVQAACDFLEQIPPDVAVQRLMGDTTTTGVLLAPAWPETKGEVLRNITAEFRRRGTTQGWALRPARRRRAATASATP